MSHRRAIRGGIILGSRESKVRSLKAKWEIIPGHESPPPPPPLDSSQQRVLSLSLVQGFLYILWSARGANLSTPGDHNSWWTRHDALKERMRQEIAWKGSRARALPRLLRLQRPSVAASCFIDEAPPFLCCFRGKCIGKYSEEESEGKGYESDWTSWMDLWK